MLPMMEKGGVYSDSCCDTSCCSESGQDCCSEELELTKVATPDVKLSKNLQEFFKCSPKEFAKTLIYKG